MTAVVTQVSCVCRSNPSRFASSPSRQVLATDPEAMREVHERYLRHMWAEAALQQRAAEDSGNGKKAARYMIDKQMSNAWWLGAVPRCARVVVLERDPMELGFGNFKTHFSSAGYEFS